jgi:hypothetical protein
MSGGDLNHTDFVERYLLDLSAKRFFVACGERKTQERIAAMLKTANL